MMDSLFDRRAKTAPSSYPRLLFHGIRTFQLLASLVVGAIMLYFIWHLTHDHWKTPWTFIWLTSASLFSILTLSTTIILHCFTGLNASLNLAANAGLSVLWCLSWSLLTWYMSGTLTNLCDISHWNEDVGIMVCRLYKTLFSFTLLGMVSTLGALALDIWVRRQQTRQGMYRLHDIDAKRTSPIRRSFTDDASDDERRDSDVWEAPSQPSTGPHVDSGYSVPENQFSYDTGYHGAHPKPYQEGRLYGE